MGDQGQLSKIICNVSFEKLNFIRKKTGSDQIRSCYSAQTQPGHCSRIRHSVGRYLLLGKNKLNKATECATNHGIIVNCFSSHFRQVGFFNTVDSKQTFNKDFVDDWIQTIDLWFQNQPLCQLSHNHWPPVCISVLLVSF